MAGLAGAAAGLEIGDPAPAVQAGEWIKGAPADLAKGRSKAIYVLEFWATWCGPCRMSIPHLSELQAKYKDKGVVIIGISSEEPDKIKAFVEKMGEKMAYTVAADKQKETSRIYMEGFEVKGIPHAFIVDKQGRIAWSGSPMGGMDEALQQIIADRFDLAASKRQVMAGRLMREYFAALIKADGLEDEQGKRQGLLEAKKVGLQVCALGQKSAEVLNELSWDILTHPKVKSRDLGLALKAGKMAYELTKRKDPAVADTYARALWDSGKKAEAVQLEKQAVELARNTDERMAKSLQETLANYEQEMSTGAGESKEAGVVPMKQGAAGASGAGRATPSAP